jgi:catechol 2,3-dioxygenase-like lactoylglutathione lyase family enzyme
VESITESGTSASVFDHVTITVSDREASERFYDTVLATLHIEKTASTAEFAEWGDFSLAAASPARPVTRRLHVGFGAPTRVHVDQFWNAGTAAGYRDDGAPGPRPQYTEHYYGSFLLDPDGNSAEAVHHESTRSDGIVDHLWIRVADLAASRRFYETIAPYAGLRLSHDTSERVQFTCQGGSFSLLPGEPTEHVHIAFAATGNEGVDAFHAAAVAAGYEPSGAPAERPEYHPGYYAAYVIDPAGFNVELVNRNRAAG